MARSWLARLKSYKEKRTVKRLLKKISDEKDGSFFCPLPFVHLYNDNRGDWRLCCRARAFKYSVSDTTPKQHFDHPLMKEVRREMLTQRGETVSKYCQRCLGLEKDGQKSPRLLLNEGLLQSQRALRHPALICAANTMLKGDGSFPYANRCLELKLRIFGNFCNLRCYMCIPTNSTSRDEELQEIREGYWFTHLPHGDKGEFFKDEKSYEKFIEDTLELIPYVKKIRITGGEPFLLKKHYDFLERIVETEHAAEIRLAYDTNLTAFHLGSRHIETYLDRFKQVDLRVSIDNIGKKNDYIRYGTNFDKLVKNIEKAKKMPNIRLAVSCATGMLNAGDVNEIGDFFEGLNIHAKFGMCVITLPSFLQARHLPDELKRVYLERIEKSPYRDQFARLEEMIRKPRDESQYQLFLEYVQDLDNHRGTSFLDLWPEFKPSLAASA